MTGRASYGSLLSGSTFPRCRGAIKAVEGILVIPRSTLPCCWRSALYATVGGMGNARELARLCREHAGFEVLRGSVGMIHTMLAEFRVVHGAVLEPLLVGSFAAMLRTGQGSLDGLFKTARYRSTWVILTQAA
jgi:hypothetical protein